MEQTLPIHAASAAASWSPPSLSTTMDEDDAKKTEELEKKHKRTNIFTYIVMALILATFGFQGIAIAYHTDKVIIIVSGVFSGIVASTAAVKQIIMRRMDTLRMVHNKIRMEVNRFMEENNKLTRNVDGLEDQVWKLQDVEKQLNSIAMRQGATADELVQLVKENSKTLRQQKMLAKADLQEQLLATVLRTDRDGNLQIDDREASILILRMKNHGGLEFDEEKVRNALVQTNGSLPALLSILRQIGKEEDEEDDVEKQKKNEENGEEKEEVLVRVNSKKFIESVKLQYSDFSGMSDLGESENPL